MSVRPPDLADPQARDAYRGELRRVALGLRITSIALVLAGGVGVLVARAPSWTPPDWLRPLGLVLALAGLVGMIAAMALRTRYHSRRMAGQAVE